MSSFTRDLGDGRVTISTTNYESSETSFQTARGEGIEAAFGKLNVADKDETSLKVVNIESNDTLTPSTSMLQTQQPPSLSAVSIESNDRVPQTRTLTSPAHQSQQQATEIYSRTIRDNSQSTTPKFMRDKNVDAIKGMNINSTGI